MLLMWLMACTGAPETQDTDPVRDGLLFRLPLSRPDDISGLVGVDHDPEVHDDSVLGGAICTTYDDRGFPSCYDEHDGNDYLLDGGFDAMDAGSTPIVAAADGVVVETEDGHYDRCRPVNGEVDCNGGPLFANYVIVEHEDGVRTKYWHMMSGSVAVALGDAVRCGDQLGIVGSSGISSTPHLHFEVQAANGSVIDPYAGPLSQERSWWVEQGDDWEDLPLDRCQTR